MTVAVKRADTRLAPRSCFGAQPRRGIQTGVHQRLRLGGVSPITATRTRRPRRRRIRKWVFARSRSRPRLRPRPRPRAFFAGRWSRCVRRGRRRGAPKAASRASPRVSRTSRRGIQPAGIQTGAHERLTGRGGDAEETARISSPRASPVPPPIRTIRAPSRLRFRRRRRRVADAFRAFRRPAPSRSLGRSSDGRTRSPPRRDERRTATPRVPLPGNARNQRPCSPGYARARADPSPARGFRSEPAHPRQDASRIGRRHAPDPRAAPRPARSPVRSAASRRGEPRVHRAVRGGVVGLSRGAQE